MRLRVKCNRCRPCEKTRSTAVEVAEIQISREQIKEQKTYQGCLNSQVPCVKDSDKSGGYGPTSREDP